MKLKIYVCTEEETKEGRCEPCQTEACYYKGKKTITLQENELLTFIERRLALTNVQERINLRSFPFDQLQMGKYKTK